MFFLNMAVSTEALKQDLDGLTYTQLQQVADFVAFLKFRSQRHREAILDPTQLATFFAEFAEEDRYLAEAGIGDYAVMLQQED
jgi:ribosomal silencing factor RsfS